MCSLARDFDPCALPVVPVRAEGMTVYGADGRAYLDCLSGAGTLALGHNHPVAVAAIRRALDRPDRDGESTAAEFANTVLGILPPGMRADARIVFCGPDPDGARARAVELTARHGATFVADETRTGLGRTGELWGVDHAGITPDVMVLPASIGGGLPLSVIACRRVLRQDPVSGSAGHRGGRRLAMAAGIATIDYVLEHDLAARARKVGEVIRRALRDAADHLPAIGGVCGRGLLLGIELVDPDSSPDVLGARTAAPGLAREVHAAARDRGLLLALGGRHRAVVRLDPPLTITDSETDQVVCGLLDAIADTQRIRSDLARMRA